MAMMIRDRISKRWDEDDDDMMMFILRALFTLGSRGRREKEKRHTSVLTGPDLPYETLTFSVVCCVLTD
jgi:hypothetical protein